MAQVVTLSAPLTVADLVDLFGPIPAWRIRNEPAPGTATEKDVVEIEARENRLCELVDGVLVEKTVGYDESCLAVELSRLIANFVKKHRLGRVSGEAGMMRLFPGLVRIPDVAFASWSKFPSREYLGKPIPDLVPDLAVEVLSEGNTAKEMSRKLDDYFDAGVRLVWFVNPRKRAVDVFTAKDECVTFSEQQTLTGGDVLPGFKLPLKELFAEVPRPRRRKPKK
jgi:Uma2 family endonuclease